MQQVQMMRMMDLSGFGPEPTGRALRLGRRVVVRQWEQGLLFRFGRLETVLDAGPHRRWRRGYTLRTVDLRPWIVQVPVQEIPTADGATVKITVAGSARIADPKAYVIATRASDEALYLGIQVALRELVAATTVEDLLAGRGDLGAALLQRVSGLAELGIVVEQLELKDIVLPSDLKRAQTEILLARAQGSAALERARGETAALRSLANAARMAADNPALVQLRLLQQLESSTGHTVVIGAVPLGAAVSTVAAGVTAAPVARSTKAQPRKR
jgi:regulator of protease activity HflC (stomatin/prohibitin superfamily)